MCVFFLKLSCVALSRRCSYGIRWMLFSQTVSLLMPDTFFVLAHKFTRFTDVKATFFCPRVMFGFFFDSKCRANHTVIKIILVMLQKLWYRCQTLMTMQWMNDFLWNDFFYFRFFKLNFISDMINQIKMRLTEIFMPFRMLFNDFSVILTFSWLILATFYYSDIIESSVVL